MGMWTVVATLGGVLSVIALAAELRRYRRGEITRRYVLALFVGWISFVSYAVINAARPELAGEPLSLAILLPAFVAIVLVIRERNKVKRVE